MVANLHELASLMKSSLIDINSANTSRHGRDPLRRASCHALMFLAVGEAVYILEQKAPRIRSINDRSINRPKICRFSTFDLLSRIGGAAGSCVVNPFAREAAPQRSATMFAWRAISSQPFPERCHTAVNRRCEVLPASGNVPAQPVVSEPATTAMLS